MVKALNKSSSQIPTLSTDTITASTDKDKTILLNSHITGCFNTLVPPLELLYIQLVPHQSEFPTNLLCTCEEVYYLLSTIDPTKSAGTDMITARMLRSTAASITPAITELFNKSLICRTLPTEWKVARVVPIPKSGNKACPANYRLISLLPLLSKLLEKHAC